MSLRDLKYYSIHLQHMTSDISFRYIYMHFISGFFQPGFLFLCIHRAEANGNTNSPLLCEKKNHQNKTTTEKPTKVRKVRALAQVRAPRFLLNYNWAKGIKKFREIKCPVGRWRSSVPNEIVPHSPGIYTSFLHSGQLCQDKSTLQSS